MSTGSNEYSNREAEEAAVPTELSEDFNLVKEGKAEVLFPKSVFYNPVQEFNRDLTIAVITVYERVTKLMKKEIDVTLAEGTGGNVTDVATETRGLRILEGLAASGLRSVRFAKEIVGIDKIVANDFDKTAVGFIAKNIEKNDVGDVMTASHDDAAMLMYRHRGFRDRFHVIDLDPYGSPAVFLDAAVQAVVEGGLLCVTCTDTAVLCGNASETCHSKYGAVSLRAKFCHEMALRILLRSIESHANRYSRYVVPLLSLSVDFYVRVFVRVYTGQGKVKQSVSKTSTVYHCVGCGSFYLQPMGVKTPTGGNNYKYAPATGPIVGEKCANCGSPFHIGGPIWADPIHDSSFVGLLLDFVSEKMDCFNTSSRMRGMLSLVTEELQDVPLYYVSSALCSVLHCISPTFVQIRSAILNAGYRVSMSHAASESIKTDAPPAVIWDIMRCWVKENPIKERWLIEGTPTKHILDRQPLLTADFSERPDANPPSRQSGLVRFQLNPEPEWGPRARAKRAGNAGDSAADIVQATATRRQEKQGRRRSLKRPVDDVDPQLKIYPCKRYALGECDAGTNCRYSHDADTVHAQPVAQVSIEPDDHE